jgi:hypothetical protein
MKTLYVEQSPGFGLGNFINLTPTIKALSYDHKIKVWFNDKFIRDCFVDCPFMEIVDTRQRNPVLHSGMINLKNDMPDYEFVWRKFFKSPVSEHTYIDTPLGSPEAAFIGPYAVVLNGSGSLKRAYIEKKNPDADAYNHVLAEIDKLYGPDIRKIFVGTVNDYNRMMNVRLSDFVCKHIRTALSIINRSTVVIANDCGLAHAAAAMGKRLFILWKDTMLMKNMNPGVIVGNCVIIEKKNWLNFNLDMREEIS